MQLMPDGLRDIPGFLYLLAYATLLPGPASRTMQHQSSHVRDASSPAMIFAAAGMRYHAIYGLRAAGHRLAQR